MIKSAVYSRLKSNNDLVSKLAVMEGEPAIYDVWPLEDSKFPYVVYRIAESKNFRHPYKSQFTLYIDVWDYNESSSILSGLISNILKREFHWKTMKHPKYGAMQSWLLSRDELQTDLPGIKHIAHQFTVEAWDKDI